jgi:hypothetical protein
MTVPSGTYIEVNGENRQIEGELREAEGKITQVEPNPREIARLARQEYDGSELFEEQHSEQTT